MVCESGGMMSKPLSPTDENGPGFTGRFQLAPIYAEKTQLANYRVSVATPIKNKY